MRPANCLTCVQEQSDFVRDAAGDIMLDVSGDPAKYRIFLHLEGCKNGGSISWLCCPPEDYGAGRTAPLCAVASDPVNQPWCTCDASSGSCNTATGVEGTAAGFKCGSTTGVYVDVDYATTTIKVQVHDGQQAGVGPAAEPANGCPGRDCTCPGPSCCGGYSSSCTNSDANPSGDQSGVCNYFLDVSACRPAYDPPVQLSRGCTVTLVSWQGRGGGGCGLRSDGWHAWQQQQAPAAPTCASLHRAAERARLPPPRAAGLVQAAGQPSGLGRGLLVFLAHSHHGHSEAGRHSLLHAGTDRHSQHRTRQDGESFASGGCRQKVEAACP